LKNVAVQKNLPDLVLMRHPYLHDLNTRGLVKNIRPLVDDSTVIRSRIGALSALGFPEALYGLALRCHVPALFYRMDLTSEPMFTLGDLLSVANVETPVGMDLSLSSSSWGISAFGGQLFDDDGGLGVAHGGFTEWLTWLRAAKQQGMVLENDSKTLLSQFVNGDIAYLIADSSLLPVLYDSLSVEQVGVTSLPPGPEGEFPMPMLQVEALVFPSGHDDTDTQQALALAEFLTSDESQTALVRAIYAIPTNQMTMVTLDDPAVTVLSELAEYTLIMPDTAVMERLNVAAQQVYADLFAGRITPDEGVDAFTRAIEASSDNPSSSTGGAE